eukprot:928737_1
MFECRSCFQMKPEPSSWRGNELWCSRCILVDGLDKEHDRTPPSRSAGSGRLFGQCGSCSKDVCGKAIKTKNAVFHTKCFVCAKCDQSLVGKGHVTQPNGRPFCKSCNIDATMTTANGVRYMPGKVVTYIDGLRVDHVGKVRRIHDSTGLVAVVNGDINRCGGRNYNIGGGRSGGHSYDLTTKRMWNNQDRSYGHGDQSCGGGGYSDCGENRHVFLDRLSMKCS